MFWMGLRSFRRRPAVLFLTLVLSLCLPLTAQRRKSKHPKVKQGSPVVEEVTPPNWWSGLPNPMLLLHGKNLIGADVTSSMAGISVRRMKISANGHWAFVWLDISSAPPQNLDLLVRTSGGKIRVPYRLEKRHAATDGFQGFSPADVMYLVLPDRFSDGDASNNNPAHIPATFDRANPSAYHGGDLLGIENHLDYIQQLGATTLWVTPLYAQDVVSAADYSGYSPIDLYRMNSHFGALQDYENLAQALHTRGMKLVLDMVMNHVSPKSPWVLDPPTADWFHGTPEQHLEASADYASMTDPHAAPADYEAITHGWLFNTLPDLNQSNPLVKQYLIQNAVWWIETGTLDGLRLDTFPNVDRSFWQDFHAELRALYPRLTTVGEIVSPDPTIVSYFAGGVKHAGIDTGLYTPFDFPSYFTLRAAFTGTSPTGNAPMTNLTRVGRQDWLYPHPERLVTFFGDQDVRRFLAEPGATPARMRLAFGLIATLRGMPQIYYGDEIAMSGRTDNRGDFPGGFPGDTGNAFTADGRTPQQQAMHDWVAGLLQLRAHHNALQTGTQQNLLADDNGLVFARIASPPANSSSATRAEIMLVLLNKSAAPRIFHLDFSHTALDGVGTLSPGWNTKQAVTVSDNKCDVSVGPEQLMVLMAQP